VLLPTPPLPLRTRIFFLTARRRSRISGKSGSGSLGSSDAQNDWFGQPSQAELLPASVDSVP